MTIIYQDAIWTGWNSCKFKTARVHWPIQCRVSSMTWCRHQMETFSAFLAICAGISPVTGEFPTQRPVMRGYAVFFDLCLDKRFSKQSWGYGFDTPSRPLWRHCNDMIWWIAYSFLKFAMGSTLSELGRVPIIYFLPCHLLMLHHSVQHNLHSGTKTHDNHPIRLRTLQFTNWLYGNMIKHSCALKVNHRILFRCSLLITEYFSYHLVYGVNKYVFYSIYINLRMFCCTVFCSCNIISYYLIYMLS